MKQYRSRVLVVAESDVLAARIETALGERADLSIMAGRLRSLRPLIEEHDPTVVVLAASTSRAASALATLVGVLRAPPLILLVDDPPAAWSAAARRSGVHAVLNLDAPVQHITAAIKAAAIGLITLHPDVFRAAARAAIGATAEDRALTARERQILEMMSEGLSNPVIARRLGISRYTVKFHVASILGKLGAASRMEAVTFGVRSGVISL
jgi:DNA-binding NarL/FixJ family response regulator